MFNEAGIEEFIVQEIEVPPHIQGLIFDCDGTLVDSMPLHMRAWEEIILRHGGHWDFDYFFSKKGMPTGNIVALYSREFGYGFDVDLMVREKEQQFLLHLAELRPIPAVADVALRNHGLRPLSVASGSTRRMVDIQLESVDLLKLFDAVVTADDNVRPKPEPDIFLEAARRMNVEPHLCQVFEDGDLGLEAARKAGMMATDIRPFE